MKQGCPVVPLCFTIPICRWQPFLLKNHIKFTRKSLTVANIGMLRDTKSILKKKNKTSNILKINFERKVEKHIPFKLTPKNYLGWRIWVREKPCSPNREIFRTEPYWFTKSKSPNLSDSHLGVFLSAVCSAPTPTELNASCKAPLEVPATVGAM